MKKLIFILFLISIPLFGQAKQTIPDSLAQHRTEINALSDSVEIFSDSTISYATRIATKLSLSGGTMTGDLIFSDGDIAYFGTGSDAYIYHTGGAFSLTNTVGTFALGSTAGALQISTTNQDISFWTGTGSGRWVIGATNGALYPYSTSTYDLGTTAKKIDSIYVDDLDVTTSIAIGDANVTETELEILDGATVTTSELNILDGVTATYSELNALDGITATVTELNYTDGVTSNIQTQLDSKMATASLGATIRDSIGAKIYPANFYISYPQSGQTSVPLVLGNAEITSVKAVIQGGTSVVFNLAIDNNITEEDAYVYASDKTVTSTTTLQDFGTSFAEEQIDDNYFLILKVVTVTGTVEGIHVVVKYKEGD